MFHLLLPLVGGLSSILLFGCSRKKDCELCKINGPPEEDDAYRIYDIHKKDSNTQHQAKVSKKPPLPRFQSSSGSESRLTEQEKTAKSYVPLKRDPRAERRQAREDEQRAYENGKKGWRAGGKVYPLTYNPSRPVPRTRSESDRESEKKESSTGRGEKSDDTSEGVPLVPLKGGPSYTEDDETKSSRKKKTSKEKV